MLTVELGQGIFVARWHVGAQAPPRHAHTSRVLGSGTGANAVDRKSVFFGVFAGFF